MEKVLFIDEDWVFRYLGKANISDDEPQDIKDRIVEVEISNSDFEKVQNYGSRILYSDWAISIIESDLVKYKYITDRQREYPNFLDYIDAQVKKASDNHIIASEGYTQETVYLEKCLLVKEKYPKPIS